MKKGVLLFLILIAPTLAFSAEITRKNTVKSFFKENSKLLIESEAIDHYIEELNTLSSNVSEKASSLAQREGRKKISKRDILLATKEMLGQSPVTIEELLQKIQLLSLTDLAKLNRLVKEYSDELLEKSRNQ